MTSPRRPSRSASIPIPGAAGRSLDDILNFSSLSPTSPTGGAPTSPRQERSQQRAASIARSLYGGLEGIRPPHSTSSITHRAGSGSTSTSLGSTSLAGPARHALGGGSNPPWAPSRSVSAMSAVAGSSTTSASHHYRAPSATHPREITGFEPRIVQGTPPSNSSRERNGSITHMDLGFPASSMGSRDAHGHASISPSRRSFRISTGGLGVVPRRTLPGQQEGIETSAASTPSAAHYTQIATGAPVPFATPTYLQYSSLHDYMQTDVGTTSREDHGVRNTRRASVGTSLSSSGRDVTPMTESDDDSESSTIGVVTHSRIPSGGMHSRTRERGRNRERPNSYNHSAHSQRVLKLPTKWNVQDSDGSLKVSEDGRNLHFHGQSIQKEREASAARANHPIPPACGIYYYEATVMDKGCKGHISVGFSTKNVSLHRLPGWEKESWGYHGDDGHSFASEKDGTPFGPRFTTGDVIGCGIDFSLYKAFYTKNGTFLGYAFENIGKDSEIYPSIGLRTSGESLRTNFGQDTFRFDIDNHVHSARERAWAKIQSTAIRWSIDDVRDIFVLESDNSSPTAAGPMPSSTTGTGVKNEADSNKAVKQEVADEDYAPIQVPPDYQEPLNKLVMSYLMHHGFERTADAFQAQRESREKKRQEQKANREAVTGRGAMDKTDVDDVDIKMETDDYLPGTSAQEDFNVRSDLVRIEGTDSSRGRMNSLRSRQRIVNAIVSGDIDTALKMAQDDCPVVLEREQGIMHFKLRCRKFAELMLQTSSALKRVQSEAEVTGGVTGGAAPGSAMDIDVEEDLRPPTSATNGFTGSDTAKVIAIPGSRGMKRSHSSHSGSSQAVADYQRALSEALAYGRKLQSDYLTDTRPEVQNLLKRTFSLVTYDDPAVARGDVAELVSDEARADLAQEMNQVILESQGRPSRPALERIYRQASVTVTQLALWGVGEAAFADINREFGDVCI